VCGGGWGGVGGGGRRRGATRWVRQGTRHRTGRDAGVFLKAHICMDWTTEGCKGEKTRGGGAGNGGLSWLGFASLAKTQRRRKGAWVTGVHCRCMRA
jgi:hypothetical protein